MRRGARPPLGVMALAVTAVLVIGIVSVGVVEALQARIVSGTTRHRFLWLRESVARAAEGKLVGLEESHTNDTLGRLSNDLSHTLARVTEVIFRMDESALGSEGAGGKLATQVGETLASVAQIAAQASLVEQSAAADVTVATNRITTMSIANSNQIADLLRLLSDFSIEETTEEADALTRLTLANTILKHMPWIGRVRSVIDGKLDPSGEDISDHTACDLGKRLRSEGRNLVNDQQAYEKLYSSHKALHDTGATLVGNLAAAQLDTVESDFATLLATSRTAVEMLSSYQRGENLRWTPALSVSVPMFDGHHRRLFGIVDRLYRAMQTGAAMGVLQDTYDELLEYTVYHIQSEEKAFDAFRYPHADDHKRYHGELVATAQKLRANLEAGKTMIAIDVIEVLVRLGYQPHKRPGRALRRVPQGSRCGGVAGRFEGLSRART